MFAPLAFLALAAAPVSPASDARAQEGAGESRFQGLFSDWGSINRQALRTERAQPAAPARSSGEARDLGELVGRIVAAGDCAEGERIARRAGDFALVDAVRAHCAATDPR